MSEFQITQNKDTIRLQYYKYRTTNVTILLYNLISCDSRKHEFDRSGSHHKGECSALAACSPQCASLFWSRLAQSCRDVFPMALGPSRDVRLTPLPSYSNISNLDINTYYAAISTNSETNESINIYNFQHLL